MKKSYLAAVALSASAVAIPASAFEFIVGAGQGQWRKCGGVGCWDQPPLPTSWDLQSQVSEFGVRYKDVELSFHDFGRTGSDGVYVFDEDYAWQTQTIAAGAKQWTSRQHNSARGIALRYAPRFEGSTFYASPRIGVLVYQNKRDTWSVWPGSTEVDYHHDSKNNFTPTLGLALGAKIDSLRIEAVADAYKMIKAHHYYSTGGEPGFNKLPGVMTYSLRLTWELK